MIENITEIIEKMAEAIKNKFQVEYNRNGISIIDDYLKTESYKNDYADDGDLIRDIAAFIGVCLVKDLGGVWIDDDPEEHAYVDFPDLMGCYPLSIAFNAVHRGESLVNIYDEIVYIIAGGTIVEPDITVLQLNYTSEELKEMADEISEEYELSFDIDGVVKIEDTFKHFLSQLKGADLRPLAEKIGAFVGECLIKEFGGTWICDDPTESFPYVKLKNGNEMLPMLKVVNMIEQVNPMPLTAFYSFGSMETERKTRLYEPPFLSE